MADSVTSPYFLLVLLIAAFALPLVYLVWIRNSVRSGREPWSTVLKAFSWGAVLSVIIALLLSLVFILILEQVGPVNDFFARRFADPTTAIGVLVVAPIVEEAAKGVGATAGRSQTLVVVAVRSFSSSFLHASSTAVFGYGLAKSWLTRRPWAMIPFYFVAVGMHATFNFFSTLAFAYSDQNNVVGEALAFVAAVTLAIVAFSIVRLRLASGRPASR